MPVTVANLLERIEDAGLPKQWVRNHIFPHWWDKHCDEAADHDSSMMATLEVTLARALGILIEDLRNEDAALTIKLDYAPKALVRAMRPECRCTHLGMAVTYDGYVSTVSQRW